MSKTQSAPELPTVEREAFSIPEIAGWLGVSRRTVYSEIASGRLKAVRIGTRRLVTRTDRDAYLDARRAEAA